MEEQKLLATMLKHPWEKVIAYPVDWRPVRKAYDAGINPVSFRRTVRYRRYGM